jgi:hypothetical protein
MGRFTSSEIVCCFAIFVEGYFSWCGWFWVLVCFGATTDGALWPFDWAWDDGLGRDNSAVLVLEGAHGAGYCDGFAGDVGGVFGC